MMKSPTDLAEDIINECTSGIPLPNSEVLKHYIARHIEEARGHDLEYLRKENNHLRELLLKIRAFTIEVA